MPTGIKFDISLLIGKKFSRLTILEILPKLDSKHTKCLCICDCGKRVIKRLESIVSGNTKSCGCLNWETLHKNFVTHGVCAKNREFYTNHYRTMLYRCYNKNAGNYCNYGAKGIGVCERWRGKNGAENFYNDMFPTWKDGLTLDRIDSSKDYFPENCRWATKIEQANNKSSNVYLTYNGETLTIANWVRKFNIPRHVIRDRLKKGWSLDDVFNIPVTKRQKHKE